MTAAPILNRLLAGCACTLEGIEHRSRMYGGPEAVEFTALQAVELRQTILRPRATLANPSEVSDAWHRFTELVLGEETNTYLHVHLREEGRLDELPRLLGDAARWIAREWPAEELT